MNFALKYGMHVLSQDGQKKPRASRSMKRCPCHIVTFVSQYPDHICHSQRADGHASGKNGHRYVLEIRPAKSSFDTHAVGGVLSSSCSPIRETQGKAGIEAGGKCRGGEGEVLGRIKKKPKHRDLTDAGAGAIGVGSSVNSLLVLAHSLVTLKD
jgi:hypothetical protein